jgi:hypothetical protein
VSPPDGRTVEIQARRKVRTVNLARGRPATLLVGVREPGQVEIPGLGLIADAEPLTPARFDLLLASPGRYRVLLRRSRTPGRSVAVGVLTVK